MTQQPGRMQRLRIAVLNRNFVPTGGGAERYSIALVEELARSHEVHVFAQRVQHQWPGVTYHLLSAPLSRPRWINQLWFAWTSWRATRQGFDVVHSHENTWHGAVQTVHVLPLWFSLFQGRVGLRLLLRWAQVLTSLRLLAYLGLETLRYRARPGRQIVATSQSLRDVMARTFTQTIPNLHVLTPGVAAVPGRAHATVRLSNRLRLGLPADGKCLLFVGNDYRKKGLSALLAALRELPPACYVAVVGNGQHIPEFQSLANKLGIGARTHFLGALTDVSAAYGAADMLVHPTWEDSFAMVVLEAMAHGLPVVLSAPKYCGIAALLRHRQDALILDDPGDSAALAQFVRDVLGDAELALRLEQAGIGFARQHLCSRMACEQEAIYAMAVESSPRA